MNIKVLLNRILEKLKFLRNEVHYVGGSEALPPPLKKDDEEELVEKLIRGDE